MPKRKCTFNDSLQAKYPFINGINITSNVRWEKCPTECSVSHSGVGPLSTKKYKNPDCVSPLQVLQYLIFLWNQTSHFLMIWMSPQQVCGLIVLYKKNHSFRSNGCASKLIQTCFDQKFRCTRMEIEAIVKMILVNPTVS